MKRLKMLAVIGVAAAVVGCATPLKMDVNKEAKSLDLTQKSVVLMTGRFSNPLKKTGGYQPQAFVVNVEKEIVKGSEDRLNFLVDAEGTVIEPQETRYLFRMTLPPGKYVIRGITGFAGVFPIRGNFFLPLHAEINVTPKSVVYVGEIHGKVRPRDEKINEFRAGPVVPLIDQSVTGFSVGTWDVNINDAYDQDVTKFKREFSVLTPVSVDKQMLPPFDRKKAQKWWEDN